MPWKIWNFEDRPLHLLCGARQDVGRGIVWLPAFGRFALDDEHSQYPGLVGLPGGLGDPGFAGLRSAVWAIVRLDAGDAAEALVFEDGPFEGLRFRSGFVVHRGGRRSALDLLTRLGCDPAGWAGGLLRFSGADGVAVAGPDGFAEAGDEGLAFAGPRGEARCGCSGMARAGAGGTAEGGDGALAVVGRLGSARCGTGGLAVAQSDAVAVAGADGVAVALGRDCVVEAGWGGAAIAEGPARLVRVGRAGIGIVRASAKAIAVDEDGLCLHPGPLATYTLVRLGRGAVLLHGVQDGGPLRQVVGGSDCAPDGGTFVFRDGSWYPAAWEIDIYALDPDRGWAVTDEDAEASRRPVAPDLRAPPQDQPWWRVAAYHDPASRCAERWPAPGDTVVLTRPVPDAAQDEEGRVARDWMGLPWGQGDLSLPEGSTCMLVRIETPSEADERGAVSCRGGDILYHGNLRGAVAALVAMGADPEGMGLDIALAGEGGVARVNPGRNPTGGSPMASQGVMEEDETDPDNWTDVPMLTGDPARPIRPSLAVAGPAGIAICAGEAHADADGVAWALERGSARVRGSGIAVGDFGRAVAGTDGIAWIRAPTTPWGRFGRRWPGAPPQAEVCSRGLAVCAVPGGRATAAAAGIAVVAEGGSATCGTLGLAVCLSSGGLASGGRDAVAVAARGNVCGLAGALLVARDETGRWIHGRVEEDGLAEGVPYVAAGGRFVPRVVVLPRAARRGGSDRSGATRRRRS